MPGGADRMPVLGIMVFGCAGPPDAPNPQPQHPALGTVAGPKPGKTSSGPNAGNVAPTQIPTFTKRGRV